MAKRRELKKSLHKADIFGTITKFVKIKFCCHENDGEVKVS